ncbi:hypothetical protein RJT34_27458 [Clitoria ternatea]|uniref:Uncharacterized protein n=1 Tax=Clitoria ternatea TaxID=43366 RepID=A0AAN9FCL2_CLITE
MNTNKILHYSEPNHNSNTQLQVWNNAAFDDDDNDNDDYFPMKTSWSSSDCTKENLSPTALNSSPKPYKPKFKSHSTNKVKAFSSFADDRKKNIDDEIQEIETEIKRLTTRLDALRLEKAKRSALVEKRVGRVVPAKFMEPKQNGVVLKKPAEETPKPKRRGVSLGPAEIAGWVPPGKAEIAVTPAAQSRRKSCFWKLPEITEEERGKTYAGRVNSSATLGSRKGAKKKEEALVIEPKKLLFSEREKSVNVSYKKGLKQGRVVASRYNSSQCGDVKKRSLPENGGGSEVRVKKRWEIPNKSSEEEQEQGVSGVVFLPKIKTLKCVNESPRDSGAAKRVAELVGKKSYFCPDERDVSQVLDFAEEEEG